MRAPSRAPAHSAQDSLPLFELNGAAYESKTRSTPNMLGAMVASGLFGKEIKSNPDIHSVIRSRDRPALLRFDEREPDPTFAPANSSRDVEDYFQYGSASSHLHVAAAEGHVNSVRSTATAALAFVLYGISVSLHRRIPQVRFLVKTGGNDLNAADAFGNTALHVAVERGHMGVVAALLEEGANIVPSNAQVARARQLCA